MTQSKRDNPNQNRHIDLVDIKKLISEEEYQKALSQCEVIQDSEDWTRYTVDNRIECICYKCLSLESLGMYEDSYNLATEALEITEAPDDRGLVLALLSAQLQALDRLGRINETTDIIEKGSEIIESLTDKEVISGASWRATYENRVGNIFWLKGELDNALDHYKTSLKIYEEISDAKGTGAALNNLGIIYYHKGDLDAALEFYQCSLDIYEARGMRRDTGPALGNMGIIHYQRGDLDTALDFYQRSLRIAEEYGVTYGKAATLTNMGWIFRIKNEHVLANELLQKGLEIFKSIGNDVFTSIPLFYLTLHALDQQNLILAQNYLSFLQKLHDRTPNRTIHLKSRLAEALILKQGLRMRSKVKAQTILEDIVDEEVLEFEYTALAMINLCELLVVEVESFGEIEVWYEARTLIDTLYERAQEQNSASMMGECLLLKAKFAVIEGDLQGSLVFYQQARDIATENMLSLLMNHVDEEQRIFEAEFSKWEDLIQRNLSIQQRIKQTQIEKYIREAQNMVKLLT